MNNGAINSTWQPFLQQVLKLTNDTSEGGGAEEEEDDTGAKQKEELDTRPKEEGKCSYKTLDTW